MSNRANWARWIFASVSKHFDDNKQGIQLYLQGLSNDTRTAPEFFELRMDGPFMSEVSNKEWRISIELELLVQVKKLTSNFHRIYTVTGIGIDIFKTINIFKYGNEIGDDDSHIGCLDLVSHPLGLRRNTVEVSYLGQVASNTEILEAAIVGHFKMFLTEI